jgi:Flp pilus assembly protein TadG
MKITSRAHGEEGAAAVEFALIVGVLALLIFGMLQFGLAFFQLQNLRAATREGARIGAVDGTVDDIKQRVQSASGLSTLGSSVYVKSVTGGTATTISSSTAQPCASVNGTTPDSVIAGVDLRSAPAGVQNIFTVDIPLLPSIDLRSAEVEGEFRCES